MAGAGLDSCCSKGYIYQAGVQLIQSLGDPAQYAPGMLKMGTTSIWFSGEWLILPSSPEPRPESPALTSSFQHHAKGWNTMYPGGVFLSEWSYNRIPLCPPNYTAQHRKTRYPHPTKSRPKAIHMSLQFSVPKYLHGQRLLVRVKGLDLDRGRITR